MDAEETAIGSPRPRLDALQPDPDQARGWLREELSRPEYRQSWLERLRGWLLDQLDAVARAADGLSAGSSLLVLAIAALLVIGAALLVTRLRPAGRQAARGAAVLGDTTDTADEHRRRAALALENGEWDAAVVEAMRALARSLHERGLASVQATTTAREVTLLAAAAFGGQERPLAEAATLFEEIRYGDRRATPSAARKVVDLERALAATHPSYDGHPGLPAVPR